MRLLIECLEILFVDWNFPRNWRASWEGSANNVVSFCISWNLKIWSRWHSELWRCRSLLGWGSIDLWINLSVTGVHAIFGGCFGNCMKIYRTCWGKQVWVGMGFGGWEEIGGMFFALGSVYVNWLVFRWCVYFFKCWMSFMEFC